MSYLVGKRALRRLRLTTQNPSPMKRLKRLKRVKVQSLDRPSNFKEKVKYFMLNDENFVVVPDFKKSKKGLRYMLLLLNDLYLKFLLEYSAIYCCYQTFTMLIPPNIIKPKPEDWGTCRISTISDVRDRFPQIIYIR